MYRRILVPLDGSARGEAVLPHVVELVRGSDAEVTLLHIERPVFRPSTDSARPPPRPPPPGAPAVVPDPSVSATVLGYDDDRDRLAASRTYVERVGERLRAQGLNVRVVVETETDVPERIAAIARAGETDLIALTTHPSNDWQRFAFGSVLHRVVRATNVPLLVVRVDDGGGRR